jgi:predicted amidophosphoribosyltransferase
MNNSFSDYSKITSKNGPCPVCKLHITAGLKCCRHCGHELTEKEIVDIESYAKSQKLKGIKIALIFFPLASFLISWGLIPRSLLRGFLIL